MKLYFSPFACSAAIRIALYETGITVDYIQIGKEKTTDQGEDYLLIAPKGQVAALQLDNGSVLTENPAILQFIADMKPDLGLAPLPASPQRYRLQEWLNYIATEIHKQILWMCFNSSISTETKTDIIKLIPEKISFLSKHFEDNKYLMGQFFSVADVYLFWALGMFKHLPFPICDENIRSYLKSIESRPAVIKAMKDEELAAQNYSV